MTNWRDLDSQMQQWVVRLQEDVCLTLEQSRHPVSTIAEEVSRAPADVRGGITDGSPIPLSARRDELLAFDQWLMASEKVYDPSVGRARVITQSYVCFVYLRDHWFYGLKKAFPSDTVVARCCTYLVSGELRAFRNAFAHGSWCYSPDHSAIDYWDRDGIHRSANEQELGFWQALSRVVAYATIQTFLDAGA